MAKKPIPIESRRKKTAGEDKEGVTNLSSEPRKRVRASKKWKPMTLSLGPNDTLIALSIGLKLIGPGGCAELAYYLQTRVAPTQSQLLAA
jgi:hypothetical protein